MTRAVFEFNDDTEIDSLYLVEFPSHQTLWVIHRQRGDEQWTCTIRFRTYVDDKIFGSDDSKRIIRALAGLAEHRRIVDEMLATGEALGGKVTRVEIQGDVEAFLAAAEALPQFHLRRIPLPPTTETPQ